MAKAEWGVKRTCSSCGARFDLHRADHPPRVRGGCRRDGAEQARRARGDAGHCQGRGGSGAGRGRGGGGRRRGRRRARAELEGDEEIVETEAADEEAEEEDGESAIEDVSELGDDDMADVIDTELDEEETDR